MLTFTYNFASKQIFHDNIFPHNMTKQEEANLLPNTS